MKKLLLMFMVLWCLNVYAFTETTLQDQHGNALGTSSNPLYVTGTVLSSTAWVDCVATADPSNSSICSGSNTTTTGTITAGQNTLVVASATGWTIGMGIAVTNAGSGGNTELISYITAISGTTFTLNDNAVTTESSQAVRHDDGRALQAAFDSSKNVHIRAGNYNYSSNLTVTVAKQIIGDGVVGRGNTSTGFALTNLICYSATSCGIKSSIGYSEAGGFSLQWASGVTATAGYALEAASTGSTNDRDIYFHDILVYGAYAGLKVSTAMSFSVFKHLMIGTTSGGDGDCVTVNNPSPAGDNVFEDIDCRVVLSGSNNTGAGIHITAADTNMWDKIKVLAHKNGLLIDGSSNTINNQRFLDCSFENGTTTNPLVKIIGTNTFNIALVGGEIGTPGTATGIQLDSTVTGSVSIIGTSFSSLAIGIDPNGSQNFSAFGNTFQTGMTEVSNYGSPRNFSMANSTSGGYKAISTSADSSSGGAFIGVAQDASAATTSGSRIGAFAAAAAMDNAHSFNNGGALEFFTNGLWSASSTPTNAQLKLAPSGSTTRSVVQSWLSNGNVGIGTATPPNTLYVVGTPMFTTGLNVGIGTASNTRLCIANNAVTTCP